MPVNAVSPVVNSADTSARTRLSDNYDTFLVLLTAQLQNQDPLAPMDSTQFTQQLVQFSQVEQQIRTNEQLDGLVSQYRAASAGAALSYLGRDAIIEADETYLAGGEANWAYRLPENASSMTIKVKDMSGRVVYETTTAPRTGGEHLFRWDGVKTDGSTAEDGVYQISIEATDGAGESVTPSISVRETIMGVDFTGEAPVVITPAGTRELSSIRSVLDNG
ncbi:MAG: flagellar hook assembly protein FlgD [Hyphomonadaceae bacterium]